MAKKRLDLLLCEQGYAETPEKAARLAMAGAVYAGQRRLDKPGVSIDEDVELTVRGAACPFVSRGGLKLRHALDFFRQDVAGCTAIDVGASTGGFTDVLLKAGAAKVYAVDVGYGQIDQSLRLDPRVAVLDRTNARYLTAEQIPEPVDLVVCDASFIGLATVLPAPLALTKPQARLFALVKPQFEADKRFLRKGIVTDPAVHQEVCAAAEAFVNALPGWRVEGLTQSPVRGQKGNIEFLLFARAAGLDPLENSPTSSAF